MVRTREQALKLVREFRRGLESIYGLRLKHVFLYGSYARDEADEDSDIDVAIVLEGEFNYEDELRRVSQLRAELSLRENCLLMPFFLSEEEYRRTPWAIHRHIVCEGVPV